MTMGGSGAALTAPAGAMAANTSAANTAIPVGQWGPAKQVPGLAALNVGGSARVQALTCSSPGNCAAGGMYTDAAHRQQAFAVTEAKGVWGTAVAIPNLVTLNAGGSADVRSVSCGEAGDCAIGGSYTDAKGNNNPWVADSVVGTWGKAQEVVTFDLTNIDANVGQHVGDVTSISCVSAGNCAATVTMPSIDEGPTPLAAPYVAAEVNGIWGAPQPAAIVSSTAAQLPAELSSVSCAGTPVAFCIAGGSYTDGNGRAHAIVMSALMDQNDGRGFVWGAAGEVPGITALPGYNSASPFARVDSVSCLANGDCAASGFYLDVNGNDQVFTGGAPDGGQWSNQAFPGAAELNTGGKMFVDGMSCGAPGECAVAGSFTDSSSHGQAWVDSQSGGLWRNAQQILGVNDNPFAAASSVSCAGAGFCFAGGLFTDTAGHTQAFVAGDIAGTWGGAQQIAGNLNAGGNAGVTGISCAAASSCAAGGFYTDAAGHQQGWVADDSTATSTALSVSAATITAGSEQSEKITATISPVSGGTATGTVSVVAGATQVCTITLASGTGSCSLTASQLPVGSYTLTGTYSGDAFFAGSTSAGKAVSVKTAAPATATALALSSSTVKVGQEQKEHFTATVTAPSGGTPAGKVDVKAGSVILCTITLSGGKGTCSPTASKLAAGTYQVAATYAGSTAFAASTSPNKTLTVSA
jgi:hypothetical protein